MKRVMSYRADKLVIDTRTDTHTQTDAGNDNTQRPKLASGNKFLWNQNKNNVSFNCQEGGIFSPIKDYISFYIE